MALLYVIARIFLVAGVVAWSLTFMSMFKRPLYAILLLLKSRSRIAVNNTVSGTVKKEGERK
jgi:hypothetical protein